jgi:pimeloyl-ACP methyl ester carboxylesterase
MYEIRKTDIDGLELIYIDNGYEDKKTLFFVHGWGADKYNLKAIYDRLEKDYRIVAVDLPGFGDSKAPVGVIGSREYAAFIYKFIVKIGIKKVNYIGHSFGGKIGIILSAEHPETVEKLVLIDSTGIRSRHYPSWYMKVYSFKILKFFFQKIIKNEDYVLKLKNRYGSTDYRNAGIMRDILVRNVSEDFSGLLPLIRCPVFIYWGEKDKDTPLWMAKKMHKAVKDSGLYIVKNGGHFSFLDDDRIISIIDNFARSQ